MLPSVYVNLPREEKAFVIAAIDMKIEQEKKKAKEIEHKTKKGKR
jgi:hypothetical protein